MFKHKLLREDFLRQTKSFLGVLHISSNYCNGHFSTCNSRSWKRQKLPLLLATHSYPTTVEHRGKGGANGGGTQETE